MNGWKAVRGHDSVVRLFQTVYHKGRLGHAYLFAGPPGVGKRLFAGELARALLCENRPAGELAACGQCRGCVLVQAGSHPDLHCIARPEDELELGIDIVRQVPNQLALKPARGGFKILILDDADDLNLTAANCFLKTLEEPPAHSLLILIGTAPELQLPTIRSRCQIIRFAPLSVDVLTELLQAESPEADPTRLRRLAELSGGSLGLAKELNDPAVWEFRRELGKRLGTAKLDAVGLSKFLWNFVESAGKEGGAQRRRAGLAVRLLMEWLQQALRLSVQAPTTCSAEELPALRALASQSNPERLLAWLDRCLLADRHIDRRVQLVLAIEGLADAFGAA